MDRAVYRTPRPGDLLAVRTNDPHTAEAQVVIDRVTDNGATLLMSGRWHGTHLEILVRRVGDTTNQSEQ